VNAIATTGVWCDRPFLRAKQPDPLIYNPAGREADVRRQQDRRGAANLAAVRRLALSLLRQEKTNKRGLKNKRLACALDPDYLLKVLANAAF
jgi:hypothetical protein